MVRRFLYGGCLLALTIQAGCGGDPPPAPAAPTAPSAPSAAPPMPTSAEAPPTQAAASDVYAMIPESSTGAIVIRAPKILASPFAQAEAAAKLRDDVRNQSGLELDQIEEVVVVFTGQGGVGPYGTSNPYGGEPGRSNPYGPTSPYGPTGPAPPTTAGDAAQQSAMAAVAPMMPTPESMVLVIRANAPVDQAKVRELAKVDPTEVESGEHKYYRAKDPAQGSLCFVDDRTILLGRESTLLSFFTPAAAALPTGSPYGPAVTASDPTAGAKKLGDKLREVPAELAVFGTVNVSKLQLGGGAAGTEGVPMNPAMMMAGMAATVPGGSFSLDLNSGAALSLDIEASTDETAQQLWVALQSAPGTVGMALNAQRLTTPPNTTPEQKALRDKGFEAWDQFSKTLKVTRGGENNRHVLLTGSLDKPMVESLASMMKKDILMPPGSAVARQVVEVQMKQIGLAVHKFAEETTKFPTSAKVGADGKPLLSWRVMILPQLGHKELFDQFKLDEPWDSEHNKTLVEKMPTFYSVPGVKEPGKTSLLAAIGDGTVFGNPDGATFSMATDGASSTVMIVQANADKAVTWTAPEDLTIAADKPTAGLDKTYPGVFLALWMDGQTHAVALNTAKDTTAGLFTIAGGEKLDINALIAAAAAAPTTPAEGGTEESSGKTAAYEEGWAGDAKRAIDRGYDKEGQRLALAAALLSDDDVMKKDVMHWSKINRPVHVVRIGIGVMPDPKRRQETPTNAGSGDADADDDEDEENIDRDKEFYDLAGEVGRDMVKELRDKFDDGDFGVIFEFERTSADDASGSTPVDSSMRIESRNPYGPTAPVSSGSSSDPAADPTAENAPRGLKILGKGDRKALLERAAEAEVDVLLIAAMTTKNARSTDPAIEFSLTEVATKKKIDQPSEPIPTPEKNNSSNFGSTSPSGTGANSDAEIRRKNMSKWVKQMGAALKFKPVPTLKPEAVTKHLTKVVAAGKQANPLPLLLEVRYFQAIGSLTPEDAVPFVTKVIGDEEKAKTLVNGTTEERKAVIEEYLLKVPDAPKKKPETDS